MTHYSIFNYCVQLLIESSPHQVFSGAKPDEQFEVAIERHLRQQRLSWCKADAWLLLDCNTRQGSVLICCHIKIALT